MITVVSDDIDEIATAVKVGIERKPRFIIMTGGLGPTFDDKTLGGVAAALDRELEEDKEAVEMIKEKYRRYVSEGRIDKFEMTSYRIKMAKLPKGAKPLTNPAGTAPGVLTEHEGVKLVMLPGVPEEMMAIFDKSVAPLLRKIVGDLTFFEASLEVREISESELAPMIDHVMRDNPHVYVKSHPKAAEKAHNLEVHLSTTSKDSKFARQRIGRAIIQISEMIKEKRGKVKPVKA
jgi:molybdopterin-biosynthesis enzyme MoeA-like protein